MGSLKLNYGGIVIYACSLTVALIFIVHLINPDIDPSWQPISETALGNNGWLMNVAFLLTALSIGSFLMQSKNHYSNLGGKIGKMFLTISAVGFLLAGFFNTDPAILPSDKATVSGMIHSVGAGFLGFLILSSILFIRIYIQNVNYKKYKASLFLMSLLLWVSEIYLILNMAAELPKNNGDLGPNVLIGWSGRIVFLFSILWLITISIQTKKYDNAQIENG